MLPWFCGIETGLSDFYKMTLTMIRHFYSKQKANVIDCNFVLKVRPL